MPVTKETLSGAVEKALAAAGEVVLNATLVRVPDPAFDHVTALESHVPLRVALLASALSASDSPIRQPGDRLALAAGDQAAAPRANDRLEVAGWIYRIVDASDRSMGMGMLHRLVLRPVGEVPS
ncbi:MAG: hypothetical protein K9H25_16305 [Rhodospirillum sp.]|nr:hypothetical protein [Rhodospirillum sp.]MCF8489631.1 hypothetical protein [Rhodospirillum sp.]